MRSRIKECVDPGSDLIDIACGTGQLTREFYGHAGRVVGVDLLASNTRYARRKASGSRSDPEYLQADARNLPQFGDNCFDYSVLSLAIHQFLPGERREIIRESMRISRKQIWMDYAYPSPEGLKNRLVRVVERMAGKQHFRNYLDYMGCGGLPFFAENLGLEILDTQISDSGIFEVYFLEKNA
jgi:ubiquinone/menaquinone biosynthesis C-methylase UbiE